MERGKEIRMRRWKKIILNIIFGIIILAICFVQNTVLGILCGIILIIAYTLIDTRDEHRKIISNRYNREKYYDSTRKR